MLKATRKTAARLCRLMPIKIARRFASQEDGAAAVEFALVAVPFLALLFAILETALVFFAGQTLEAAVADASRLIMTGQAQTATTPLTQATFKQAVCDRLAGGMFDCAGISVDVKNYSDFTSISNASPVVNGQLDTTKMGYSPGGPGCIEVVSVYYQWPIYVSLLDSNLANVGGSNRLLVATSVFRNEPYGTTGVCP